MYPTEIKKTTKNFLYVNKNPIKFKGEAMVEVKTEKSNEILSILITGNKYTGPRLVRQTGNRPARQQENKRPTSCRRRRKTGNNHPRLRSFIEKYSHHQRSHNRHSVEKRRQTKTAKRTSGPHPLPKESTRRARKTYR